MPASGTSRVAGARATRRRPTRLRRRIGAALGVGALATGGVALFRPPSVGADTNRPPIFSGTAAAAALHEEDNGQAGFAVYQPFYGSFAEGATSYNNDGQSARASTFYPGPTFGDTGSLICQINCAPVPAYPLSVHTSGPPSQPPSVSQQSSTHVGGSGQPASATAASADATADPATGVSSDAVDGGFAAPGASASSAPAGGQLAAAVTSFRREVALLFHQPSGAAPAPSLTTAAPAATAANPAIVAVRSMTASTAQHFVGATLVSDAETDLSGVSLLGGMIDIASVHTESHFRTDGAGIHTHTDGVTVSGVTVAGVPATIGSHGITVSGQGTGSALLDSLNADLQQALAAAGADVTLVGATAKPPQPLGGCEGDQADGVFVHTTANAQAVPLVGDIYNGDYTLGSSCASGSVSGTTLSVPGAPAGVVSGAGLPGAGAPTGAPSSGTNSGTSGATAVALGDAGTSSSAGASPSASPSGRPAVRGVATTGFLGPLVSRRFSTLYLSVVLALAAVLVGLGFHVPRPRARGTGPRSGP